MRRGFGVHLDYAAGRGERGMNSRIGMFFLVFVFAGSVVVLGAHELQQRYREKYGSSGGPNRRFFERINDGSGTPRARWSPEEVERVADEKAQGDAAKEREGGVGGFMDKLVP